MKAFDRACSFCGRVHFFEVDDTLFARWRSGEHIQKVFPDTPAEMRETMISGTCPGCWDRYMREES